MAENNDDSECEFFDEENMDEFEEEEVEDEVSLNNDVNDYDQMMDEIFFTDYKFNAEFGAHQNDSEEIVNENTNSLLPDEPLDTNTTTIPSVEEHPVLLSIQTYMSRQYKGSNANKNSKEKKGVVNSKPSSTTRSLPDSNTSLATLKKHPHYVSPSLLPPTQCIHPIGPEFVLSRITKMRQLQDNDLTNCYIDQDTLDLSRFVYPPSTIGQYKSEVMVLLPSDASLSSSNPVDKSNYSYVPISQVNADPQMRQCFETSVHHTGGYSMYNMFETKLMVFSDNSLMTIPEYNLTRSVGEVPNESINSDNSKNSQDTSLLLPHDLRSQLVLVGIHEIYDRKHVCELKTRAQWFKHGRLVADSVSEATNSNEHVLPHRVLWKKKSGLTFTLKNPNRDGSETNGINNKYTWGNDEEDRAFNRLEQIISNKDLGETETPSQDPLSQYNMISLFGIWQTIPIDADSAPKPNQATNALTPHLAVPINEYGNIDISGNGSLPPNTTLLSDLYIKTCKLLDIPYAPVITEWTQKRVNNSGNELTANNDMIAVHVDAVDVLEMAYEEERVRLSRAKKARHYYDVLDSWREIVHQAASRRKLIKETLDRQK